MAIDHELDRLLARARVDGEILAVILFGSAVRGETTPDSDIDVCLVLHDRSRDRRLLTQVRLDYASQGDLDVQVFQQLPLFVRSRVLKEGKVLFVRDEDALYELAARTTRAFEAFKPSYRAYLAEVLRAGS